MRFGTLFASVVSLPFLFTAAASTESQTIDGLTTDQIVSTLEVVTFQDINVIITADSLITNQAEVNFDVQNTLPLEVTVDRVVGSAGLNGTVFVTFDHTFSTFVIQPLGTANSGTFGDVTLTQGTEATLGIMQAGVLDLMNVDLFVREGTINGESGVPLEIDGLMQSSVPTMYTLNL